MVSNLPNNQSVVLVIPAYKPSRTLPQLLSQVFDNDADQLIRHVLIVDDGSGSDFEETFAEVALLPRVTIIRNAVNLGKGAALKAAFNYTLVNWPHHPGVVTADADGQHSAKDIVNVAQALIAEPEKLILGARSFGSSVPLRSWLGNWATRGVFRIFSGYSISDTQTGLRGWPASMCADSLRIPLNGYDFEMESLVNMDSVRSRAISIREVPIETIYLDDNESSHFNPLLDSARIYYVFLRFSSSSLAVALVDFAIFLGVLSQVGNLVTAQVASRSVAVIVSFFLARNLVFRSKSAWPYSFAKFLTLVTVMGVVSYSMIEMLHTRWGLPFATAKLIAEGTLFLGNFAIQRSFVFVHGGGESAER